MRSFGLRRAALFYGVVAALASVLMFTRVPSALHAAHDLERLATGCGMGVVAGLSVVALSRALAIHFQWARGLAQELRSLVGDLSARQALYLAAMSSVAEELLFRGVVHAALGLPLGALVFALLHTGPNRRFWPWPVMAFGAGLLFGWLYDHTGTLTAPIAAHFVVNYLNLRFLTAERRPVEILLEPVG